MRILLIHNYYQYRGGEETYVESLKKLLEDNGHKVYLYSKHSNDIRSLIDKIQVAFGLFWNIKTANELTDIINTFKPDVAHFNNIYPLIGATAYRVCKRNNIKIVQTIHNYRFMCPKGILFRNGKICELCINKQFFYPAIRFGCYRNSRFASFIYSLAFFIHKIIGSFSIINIFIFPSKFTQQYYEKHFRVPKSKSIYLPPFVDFKPTNIKVKRENWFLYVGRLSEEKGILPLLEAFTMLPNYKIVIIGEGQLKKQVSVYKKYKNIRVLGHIQRKKLISFYQKTRALIVPSLWYEIGPLVDFESSIFNTPIIRIPLKLCQNSNFVGELSNYIQRVNIRPRSSLSDIKSNSPFNYHKKLISHY